ncbi:MAG TPA: chromosome segregation protein SMC [Gemmatimonadales bacterium]|nr:chromosome segregation protein SMC [Gemmatimonadales bacterium]
MKLARLELSGFKSFADTVTLTFEEGVTAIVGPNGCGKSNVSDAVRWVLGEQSARLLRGGKMEDVIFQGAATRRPVNVTEVSLFLDNSDGTLPIAYQEVQITRRLSRSGNSDYLLNRAPVRLRDIQDLLRGTGLGGDAGVVIEAKMIDLMLSDRAEERRSLFEEAAGIGLYRDRKHSTERRLEETALDLQRVEDLIAEVQSQIRSLARQRGRAERHAKLMEEKFSVQVTLARRYLDRLAAEVREKEARHAALSEALPQQREDLAASEQAREETARSRGTSEAQRTDIARRLGQVQVELGRLEGDLNVAAERLANASARKVRAVEERGQMESRAQVAVRERDAAAQERDAAQAEYDRIQAELLSRAAAEESVRLRLTDQRAAVRGLEEELQRKAQTLRSLEGERAALESDLAGLREQAAQAATLRDGLQEELSGARRRHEAVTADAERLTQAHRAAGAETERARHLVAETREREALARAERRRGEEAVAQIAARCDALDELERDRVGLAPGAAALLAARDRFGGAVLGPLSDFLRTGREQAEVAERLLGEWVHAVLVRDAASIPQIQRWHEETQPGAVVLLPAEPGPARVSGSHPLEQQLQVEDAGAAAWVRALLVGSEILDGMGRVLRRANGAILLSGASAPSGPLRRRAELESLTADLFRARGALEVVEATLAATSTRLAELEREFAEASAAADRAREAERFAVAAREDAARIVQTLTREAAESEAQVARLQDRLARSEHRVREIDAALTEGEVAQVRLEEELGRGRALLTEAEGAQETAREQRVHWQVQLAHVEARLLGARERVNRARLSGDEATASAEALAGELAQLENDSVTIDAQKAVWEEQRAERRVALLELEAAAADAETAYAEAQAALEAAETAVHQGRVRLDEANEEHHRLQLELAEAGSERRRIVERVEAEWRKPIDELFAGAAFLDLDLETLENEASRIVAALESIGVVNPLAVEEYAEESKRLEFLTTQRDDLVAARQSLQQAIREIDGTAQSMFMETFLAIRANFLNVFQTLFGGGECDLRLSVAEDPLESEIEIHAAPRGKRTQRIHLLSSGERTLVATSLLFAIYLTKPSPFCLMDEVDAPLDDSNVGRFTRLLEEFKRDTQFLVITHNPRTMQSADAVYGVTMQEPGVSTIVGVRLGEVAA